MKLSNKNTLLLSSLMMVGAISTAHASLLSVSEINNFEKVYSYDIPSESNFDTRNPIYALDRSNEDFGVIDRVSYYMELDNNWVWVSFDAITQNLSNIAIPLGTLWQQRISNLVIESNVASVTTGSFLEGNIEFFDHCYATNQNDGGVGGSDSVYDNDDRIDTSSNCYGSMQLHNYMMNETIFAYNGWEVPGSADDLGIGSSTGIHSDWTFMNNANTYQDRLLEVFVSSSETRILTEVSAPATLSLFAIAAFGLVVRRKKA